MRRRWGIIGRVALSLCLPDHATTNFFDGLWIPDYRGALGLFGKADASPHLLVFQGYVGMISRWGGYEEECHLLLLLEGLQDGSSVRQYVFAGVVAAVRSRRPLREGAWESCRGQL